MRFVPALLLALRLPTTAYPNGGHGGVSHSYQSLSYSSVAPDSCGRIKRDPAARAAFQHRNSKIERDARNSGARLSIVNVGWYI